MAPGDRLSRAGQPEWLPYDLTANRGVCRRPIDDSDRSDVAAFLSQLLDARKLTREEGVPEDTRMGDASRALLVCELIFCDLRT